MRYQMVNKTEKDLEVGGVKIPAKTSTSVPQRFFDLKELEKLKDVEIVVKQFKIIFNGFVKKDIEENELDNLDYKTLKKIAIEKGLEFKGNISKEDLLNLLKQNLKG